VKEIIDKDIVHIKYVPDDPLNITQNWRKVRRQNKEYRKKNHEYHEILSLDTLAIPYLLERIGDTTETSIRIPCSTHNLKIGDVAFALLSDIIPIPMGLVTHSQWDVIACDTFMLGTWDYLHDSRKRFQIELIEFFKSKKGKLWIRLLKEKITKDEANRIQKELFID
jgi:hypothetical protein